MILLSDPRVAAAPVRDYGDPLVDLRTDGRLLVRADSPGALLRGGVHRRLLDAQSLLPDGIRLLVYEGYRSYADQLAIFSGYVDKLHRLRPDWDDARLRVEASKFVSPDEVAPHSTGGAVDLTLCGPDGAELDLGTVVDATPVDSDNACFTDARNISAEGAYHRSMLSKALTEAGLVNYPTEWWHWSYGDRYWALATGAAAAVHGPR